MNLLLTRNWKKSDYTIGRLFVLPDSPTEQPILLCNTLERAVNVDSAKQRIGYKPCIPAGKYEITLNVQSPKYSKKHAYDWCGGFLPRLLNVKGYDGILIHAGNDVGDTQGCILVGKNTQKGRLTESQNTLKKVYALLKKDKQNTIEIRN